MEHSSLRQTLTQYNSQSYRNFSKVHLLPCCKTATADAAGAAHKERTETLPAKPFNAKVVVQIRLEISDVAPICIRLLL